MNNNSRNVKVCPVELAGGLDSRIRRMVHKPEKILKPYIKPGVSALDLGCGPGVFTVGMAQLLGGEGKIIAADLQQGMLDKLAKKIKGSPIEQLIRLHKCSVDSVGLSEKVDFILTFYMIHEVSDHSSLFEELKELLKPGGSLLIIEPFVHVNRKSFKEMTELCISKGFEYQSMPKVFFSRTVHLRNT